MSIVKKMSTEYFTERLKGPVHFMLGLIILADYVNVLQMEFVRKVEHRENWAYHLLTFRM